MNTLRLITDTLLLFFILLGNAPLVLLLGVIGSVRFHRFWELLVAGFLFELLYGSGSWSSPFPFPMFFGASAFFVLVGLLRTRLR
jgi:hypothetical protein